MWKHSAYLIHTSLWHMDICQTNRRVQRYKKKIKEVVKKKGLKVKTL